MTFYADFWVFTDFLNSFEENKQQEMVTKYIYAEIQFALVHFSSLIIRGITKTRCVTPCYNLYYVCMCNTNALQFSHS